jgi:hypothetical protein
MGMPGIFKKVGQIKKKVDKREDKGEPIDPSIFNIGIYGHKGVGKTVFFTVAYVSSKQSPDFELMALGETQELLEEKYNLMRGQGMDIATGQRIASRRFPPLSTGEQKLNFEIRIGRNTLVPIKTIDYSGELIYIDARGEIKQNLLEFFKNCECVLFFIDPDAIANEGERSNRVAAFTDLIGQLSGHEKKLRVPVGLVVSKADELAGFKSAEQSVLVHGGNGYIRALNFPGFLRGVLKQRLVTNRPDWKGELELMLNRLESFFKPLLNRTMDYQVFFISSTGNPPEMVTGPTGEKLRVPPEDLRPLGVSQPLRWAVGRVSCYRRGLIYRAILKWAVLLIALVIDLVAFGHIYNQMKVKQLHRKVENYSRALPDANTKIAGYYNSYANNFIVSTFFGGYSRLANNEYKYFSSLGSQQAQREIRNRFTQQIGAVDAQLAGLMALRSDSAKYEAALVSIGGGLDSAEATVAGVADAIAKTEMQNQVNQRRGQLQSAPTGGQLSAATNLKQKYETLRDEFRERLSMMDYDYLLGKGPDQFPVKLAAFKDEITAADPNNQQAAAYARYIQNYLNVVSTDFQLGILIPFMVSGATGGADGYSLYFSGASEAPEGDVTGSRTDLLFRVPVQKDFTIVLRKGGEDTYQSLPIGPGYTILKFHNKRLSFTDPNIDIRLHFDMEEVFLSRFRDKL